MLRSKKAQSTLEYIIIFTAIVGAILLAASTIVGPKVKSMVTHAVGEAEDAVKQINFGKTADTPAPPIEKPAG